MAKQKHKAYVTVTFDIEVDVWGDETKVCPTEQGEAHVMQLLKDGNMSDLGIANVECNEYESEGDVPSDWVEVIEVDL